MNLLVGMFRTKIVALLLGPAGVGLVGVLQSAMGMIGTLSGFGLGQSAVKQIASTHAEGDHEQFGRTVKVVRRLCWATGLLAAAIAALISRPLSVWMFGNSERAWMLCVLGLALLWGSVSTAHSALLQGVRRIGDLARINILSAIASTILSVVIYGLLGEAGVIPVLLAIGLTNLGFYLWFARRVSVSEVALTWGDTIIEAKKFFALGFAFLWSGVLAAGVTLAIRSLIVRDLGIEVVGIYQAAWGISGLFAGFILQAMGTDFYPRLTAVANDDRQVNRLVNEQTEIGILLALPGILLTLVFSPQAIALFYTSKFAVASQLLPWFVIGVYGRVLSWPLGYIQLAKGASRSFAITESMAAVLHLLFVCVGIRILGIVGAAVAFAALYAVYLGVMLFVSARLSDFRWSRAVVSLLIVSGLLMMSELVLLASFGDVPRILLGSIAAFGSGVYVLRQIAARLDRDHRIAKAILRLPVLGRMLHT